MFKRAVRITYQYSLDSGELGGFRERVKAFTDGRGADVIYDPVGGSVFDESMRCINWGRILTSATSGVWPRQQLITF